MWASFSRSTSCAAAPDTCSCTTYCRSMEASKPLFGDLLGKSSDEIAKLVSEGEEVCWSKARDAVSAIHTHFCSKKQTCLPVLTLLCLFLDRLCGTSVEKGRACERGVQARASNQAGARAGGANGLRERCPTAGAANAIPSSGSLQPAGTTLLDATSPASTPLSSAK